MSALATSAGYHLRLTAVCERISRMATQTQRRSALTLTLQQFATGSAAEFVSSQIQEFAAAGTLDADKDYAACDASGGAFILTLPGGASVYVGKHYVVKEWEGTNAVTIDPEGAGTIDGAANLVLPAGESVILAARSVSAANLVVWDIVSQTQIAEAGSDTAAVHVNVAAEISAVAAKATPVAADYLLIEDSAAADAKASITIGTIPVAQAQVSQVVAQPAADAAFEIDATIGGVQLTVTAAGNVAITTNANAFPGQRVNLFALSVAGGGSYTLALDVGTLTLNATSEGAIVMRNAGDTAWVCVGLSGGATIV
jgi:hypothetical protein